MKLLDRKLKGRIGRVRIGKLFIKQRNKEVGARNYSDVKTMSLKGDDGDFHMSTLIDLSTEEEERRFNL